MAAQGELWTADLNPVRGSEQAGFRPVLVVSGNRVYTAAVAIFLATMWP